MTLDETLLLLKAGYSKADIEAMASPAGDPKQEPEAKPEIVLSNEQLEKLLGAKEPGEEPTIKEDEPKQTTMSDEQFEKLLQGLRSQGANIDVPKKVELDEKLADHFASLFGTSK